MCEQIYCTCKGQREFEDWTGGEWPDLPSNWPYSRLVAQKVVEKVGETVEEGTAEGRKRG